MKTFFHRRREKDKKSLGLRSFKSRKHEQSFLRVGIVGCGRVAQHHIRFINETKNARVVGLVDTNEVTARRFKAPYGVSNVHGSLDSLLDSTTLDVIHISTPPAYHYVDAMDAINRGIHVFIEKPITLNAHEAEELYSRAMTKPVLICPDFQQLFHPGFQHALSIINSGLLGRVVHVESHWSGKLDTQIAGEGRLHWSFELPGGVLRNNITHLLYLVLYFIGMPERVMVSAKSYGIMDHLSIMLEGKQCTASVVQSLVIGPQTFYVRIFCENGAILVNFETSTVLVRRKSSMPRSLNWAISTYNDAYQLCAYGTKNIINFMRRRLVPYQGLKTLVPRFYASINDSTDPPVSRELALAVTKTEEAVFGQASGDAIKQTCEVNGEPKSRSQIRDNVEITLRDSLLI